MSHIQTDTPQTRPQGQASTERPDAGGAGKHRGVAARDDAQAEPHGKHRKPGAAA
ncbi:hypothetical protein ACFYT4_01630 [Streptomyces sp. NPDC004609]|uniref:hypothetical protein n=1 Tax=Streptomyces sp. NPDC004609 TaxID=3364704 RepID=UPI0036CFCE20